MRWIPASPRTATVTGLRNGQRYFVRVIAVNAYGPGNPSWWAVATVGGGVTPVTPGNCPAAPNSPGGADPWGGCWPGPHNTGVPAGTVLRSYSGPCSITANNVVIDSMLVQCNLSIRGANLTIRNSRILGTVRTVSSTGSFTIVDSEVILSASASVGSETLIGDGNFTAIRVETSGGRRGIYCDGPCTSPRHVGSRPEHRRRRSCQRHPHVPRNGAIRHNSISCDGIRTPQGGGCSAGLTGYGDFEPVTNNLIERNLFVPATSTFCAYGGASGDTGGKPYGRAVCVHSVHRERVPTAARAADAVFTVLLRASTRRGRATSQGAMSGRTTHQWPCDPSAKPLDVAELGRAARLELHARSCQRSVRDRELWQASSTLVRATEPQRVPVHAAECRRSGRALDVVRRQVMAGLEEVRIEPDDHVRRKGLAKLAIIRYPIFRPSSASSSVGRHVATARSAAGRTACRECHSTHPPNCYERDPPRREPPTRQQGRCRGRPRPPIGWQARTEQGFPGSMGQMRNPGPAIRSRRPVKRCLAPGDDGQLIGDRGHQQLVHRRLQEHLRLAPRRAQYRH